MIKSLRESKAHLSALVARAASGEEFVITVRGKPRARLVAVVGPAARSPREKVAWARELQSAREHYSTKCMDASGPILDALRGERG